MIIEKYPKILQKNIYKLNIEKSRNYYFPSSLHDYNFDCITQTAEEVVMIDSSVEEEPESEKVTIPECPSNTYVGEEQPDGSWETVCKE